MNKPECKLIGENGNIYNLLFLAKRALINNDMKEEAEKMQNEVLSSKSYDEALMILDSYVDIH